MGLKRGAPKAGLVVPDEETWLAWADGLSDGRFRPTMEPGRAEVLLLPERVPRELAPAVRSVWNAMPPGKVAETYTAPLAGIPASELLAPADGRREDAGTEDHGDAGHGDHEGHGDMMAITGEPSADGLVMESLDVEAGPLGVALPGGLVVAASLDGDVVEACDVRQTLRWAGEGGAPDLRAAIAWSVAQLTAREQAQGSSAPPAGGWLRLASVEAERTVSHLAWLHAFCRLLGWPGLADDVRAGLSHAVPARAALAAELTSPDVPDGLAPDTVARLRDCETAVRTLLDQLAASRRLARRTAGVAELDAEAVRRRGLTGPVARGSGVAEDARGDDLGYAQLGFEPVLRSGGDARARLLVRVEEAAEASRLAAAAIERAAGAGDTGGPTFGTPPSGGLVESPRGPVCVRVSSGDLQRTAPGAQAARAAAGDLAVGREWAAALVAVASFDLSPWRLAR